jgi:hypothetical protein
LHVLRYLYLVPTPSFLIPQALLRQAHLDIGSPWAALGYCPEFVRQERYNNGKNLIDFPSSSCGTGTVSSRDWLFTGAFTDL